MDPFEELNEYHQYLMASGDSDKYGSGGSGGGKGNGGGCITLLIIGIIIYIILSLIGKS
jgi:hypothetical protein